MLEILEGAGGMLAMVWCLGWLLSWCQPKTLARFVPGWNAARWLRIGAYLQAIGRECYHQCDQVKRKPIDDKLEQVYGSHEA